MPKLNQLNQEILSRRATRNTILNLALLIQRSGADQFERDEARKIAAMIRRRGKKK
jgi:D-alanyl-D-alanine carboxypeptidase